ncbi:DsbC family protein [Thiorhodospira sibirica]|uniref:DsbC family protein n=1 Tax=Thiorhodospira sibirica TaxID=154347 RepID=UPI00022C1D09|nr:DsbC family protein [Thiorhodospira sibirica]
MKKTVHCFAALWAAYAFVFAPLAVANDQAVVDQLRERLATIIPGSPDTIVQTPVNGLYEARYGANILYLSADGRYAMQGNLVDLETRDNLTESSRTKARGELIRGVSEAQTLVYAPKGEVKHTVTIFTDVDCPYCQRLHAEIGELNNAGVKVRYILFPRSEEGSPSYVKSEHIWCASDRKKAFDAAKAGKPVAESKSCDSPIAQHRALGESMGVGGTPAIVLDSGDIIPGYRPANELVVMFEQLALINAHRNAQ